MTCKTKRLVLYLFQEVRKLKKYSIGKFAEEIGIGVEV